MQRTGKKELKLGQVFRYQPRSPRPGCFVLIVVFHKFLWPEQLPNCSWDKFGVKVETGSFYI